VAQYLIVYDQRDGRIDILEEFSDVERDAALNRRFELELKHRSDPLIEVVVLGAASRDDLMATHARYFKSVSELAEGGL
jgi:hypothetical protein